MAATDAAPAPTDAQKEAGNYAKGHARWQGLDLSIENAKGSERSGTGADGTSWSVTMPAHYGYFKGTKGADGDHVDFYMGDNEASDFVLIVDQKDADTGAFDEHKVVLGTGDAAEALRTYKAGFSDGRGADRIGGVREMTAAEFKDWLANGDTTKPASLGAGTAPQEATKNGTSLDHRPIRKDKAITARGREIPVEYAIAELDDLIPSQLDDGRDNPAYPQELQPRDRSGNRSQEQVRKIAADLKPELLGETPQAGSGAPIIGPDGYVESGNGRTLALRRAYSEGAAGKYRAYLKAQGYPVDGMRQPVLVRVRQGDMSMAERAATAREANERDTQAMSVSEQGMADAATMTASILDLYRGGDLDSAGNREFVRAFLGKVVAPADMGAMVRDDGAMTQDAVRRVQAALMARAYGDPDLIGAVMESSETSIKAIGGALTDTAARWAQMRDAAKEGDIAPEMDQTPALMEAVRLVDRARRAGRKVDEFVGQTDMFAGDTVSPAGKAFLALMFNDAPKSYGRPAGRDRLADDLLRYVTEAMRTQPGVDMLGQSADPGATLATIKGKRDGGSDAGQGGLFAAGNERAGEGAGPQQQDAGAPRGPQGQAGSRGKDQAAGEGRRKRVSVKEQRDMEGQPLYVVHNLGAEKLRHVSKLGGMAAPSLAIARGDLGFDSFGEISLVGDPSMADPKGKGVRAFSTDVYSPRQPRARFKIDGKAYRAMRAKLQPISDKYGFGIRFDERDIESHGLSEVIGSDVAKAAWLDSLGETVPIAYREMPKPEPIDGFSDFTATDPAALAADPAFVEKVERKRTLAFKSLAYGKLSDEQKASVRARWEDADGNLRRERIETLAQQVAEKNAEIAAFKPAVTDDVDTYATGKALSDIVDARADEFHDWVEAQFPAVIHGMFFQTESGAKRDYTIANLVRAMTRTIRNGEEWNYGAGSVRAAVAPEFKSLAAIKAARGQIQPESDMNALKDEVNNELFALADKFAPYHAAGTSFGWGDIFSEFLKDLAKGPRAVAEWQKGIFEKPAPDDLIQEARDFLEKLKALPTGYFEIKMQRAVQLSEFRAALIPSNASAQTRKTLADAGLELIEYDKDGGPEARRAALQRVGGKVFFQRDISSAEPVAVLRGDELGSWKDILDLQRKAQEWYRQNLQGQTVRNDSTGWDIRFTRDGRGKIGSKGEYVLTAVPALREIVAKAVKIGEAKDAKGREHIKAFHYLAAPVEIGGRQESMVVTIREMDDGRKFYDLSPDNQVGARSSRPMDAREARVEPDIELGADTLNLVLEREPVNSPAAITPDQARAINAALLRELGKVGIFGKIGLRVVAGRLTGPNGSFEGGVISILRNGRKGWRHTFDHEVVHALRSAERWAGASHGLFTPAEWRALARAARADKAIVARVEATYGDKTYAEQTEEMVAELYADWAKAKRETPPGALGQALEAIRSFFRAAASALRGEGFTDAARVMQAIADGEVGGRGPDGGQARDAQGRFVAAEQRRMIALDTALIGGDLASLSSHPDYEAAKSGDVEAAVRLARDIVTDDLVQRARETIGSRHPLIVPVISEEASGRNKIPRAAAEVLAARLGLETGTGIVQSNAPKRTALSGLDRIFASPEFVGDVAPGQDHLILDDTLTQGGTFAALASHIEGAGGRVIGAVALTGKQYSAKLRPSADTLAALRDKHGDLEDAFRAATGHGFDSLTESEARYLANFKPAESVRNRILEEGRRRGEGPDQGTAPAVAKEQRDMPDADPAPGLLNRATRRARGILSPAEWKKGPGFFSSLLTDAMGRNENLNILALTPGRALFAELGAKLPSAKTYLGLKTEMDALRNEWHARADTLAQKWAAMGRADHKANTALMDLMHASTLSGIDPTRPSDWVHPQEARARAAMKSGDPDARRWAEGIMRQIEDRAASESDMKARYDALPEAFRDLYGEVRDTYTSLADAIDAALIENVDTAAQIALRRAERRHAAALRHIADEGLAGTERDTALKEATDALTRAKARASLQTRVVKAKMRAKFESNRLSGPYFPLSRFGTYFVTIRDEKGKVTSFSRFESKADQDAFKRQAEEEGLGTVETGVLDRDADLKGMVDPTFIADIGTTLEDAGADPKLLDAIWQRWLETLPDQSIRKSHIHRKGRSGFSTDAFRAFGRQAFHGAHQLARLRFGLKLGDALDTATEEAARQPDAERAGFVVQEMKRRHEFTLNPKGNALVSTATGIAFVWYLGMTPAAAVVNLSQTTMLGVPLMAQRFGKSYAFSTRALGRAMRDFGSGKGWVERSKNLTDDERAAVREAYRRGTVDKTQGHDLAGVADSGIQYNATRERVMRKIGFMFHHAERLNREVTFLAGYRMARQGGMDHAAAIDAASDLTWKVHFSYQNSDRPRFMQGDAARLVTTFRQYQVNLLWRLFRDAHQTFSGATTAERAEAKAQLIGVSLSMMAHAGIKGTWGFGILMTLLGLFFPGGDDDAEKWLQDALLLEGQDMGTAAWNWIMGAALVGLPGKATGIDLKNRIGSPNLWFRDNGRDLEGRDQWAEITNEILGPVFGIGANAFVGMAMASEDPWRATEKMVPKMVRDMMKATRYAKDGVTTMSGDPLVENVNPYELVMTASGLTPGRISERYEINNRLKNAEKRIMGERQRLHKDLGDAVKAGKGIPDRMRERLLEFNRTYPEYPITADTLRASMQGRARASQRNEAGVALNPKLDRRLREAEARPVFN